MPSFPNGAVSLTSALGVILLIGSSCQRTIDQPRGCEALRRGAFDLRMWSPDSSYRVGGLVKIDGDDGTVSLLALSSEGAGEPIDTKLDSLRVTSDSVWFGFAPSEFRLRGRCEGINNASGEFSLPQPPFEPITGHWVLRRTAS
jgi:hypothetical protein